jgi:Transposase zinc-ribbon domain
MPTAWTSLDWLRWQGGFVCPRCGQGGRWAVADGPYKCAACGARTSVTAGTLFDRRRTPLTVWFHACWLFATAKDGLSAQHLQRALEIGSYHTAWAMLHRLRSALVRPGRGGRVGLRISETVNLDIRDWRPDLGELGKLHVRFGKGSRGRGPKTRMVPAIDAVDALLNW